MEGFFSSTFWVVISAIISVLGLFGTILGFYQYFKSAKELKEYKYLFKIAGQHVDLEDKKNKISDYEHQISNMQKTIKEQIPEEAKKIALKGILDNELQVLSSTYTKVKSLQAELESLITDDLSETEELMKKVNKIIEPAYSRRRFDNLLSSVFYLVSIVSSFLSMILPYSIYQMVIVIILLFQLIVGIRVVVNNIKLNYTKKELREIMHKAFLICSLLSFIVSLFFVILLIILLNDLYYVNEVTFLITAAVFWGIHFIFGSLFLKKEKMLNLIIWLILSLLCLISVGAFVLFLEPLFLIISVLVAVAHMIFLLKFLFKKREKH